MCLAAALPAAASAAGAASTALTVAQGVGAAISAIGTIQGGLAQASLAGAQAKAIGHQRETEAGLNAIEEARIRRQMGRETATQRAELAARGVQLDSPTSLILGREAAEETDLAGRSVRMRGQARDAELSVSQQIYRREATLAARRGGLSAAGMLLAEAPQIWNGLKGTGT